LAKKNKFRDPPCSWKSTNAICGTWVFGKKKMLLEKHKCYLRHMVCWRSLGRRACIIYLFLVSVAQIVCFRVANQHGVMAGTAGVVGQEDTAMVCGDAGGGVEMSDIMVMMQGAVSRQTETNLGLLRELEALRSREAGISTQQTQALEELNESHSSMLLARDSATAELATKLSLAQAASKESATQLSEEKKTAQDTHKRLLAQIEQKTRIIDHQNEKEQLHCYSIDQNEVSVYNCEMHLQSVVARSSEMSEDNKRLKEKISQRIKEYEVHKCEMARFKPRIMELVDKTVLEFQKCTKKFAKLDERQQKIADEQDKIVLQLQHSLQPSMDAQGPPARKRKTSEKV